MRRLISYLGTAEHVLHYTAKAQKVCPIYTSFLHTQPLPTTARHSSVLLRFGRPLGCRQAGNPPLHHGLRRLQGASGSPQDVPWGTDFFVTWVIPFLIFSRPHVPILFAPPKRPRQGPKALSRSLVPTRFQDSPTDTQTDKQTYRQTRSRTNRQTDKQTDRRTDKPTDRQQAYNCKLVYIPYFA